MMTFKTTALSIALALATGSAMAAEKVTTLNDGPIKPAPMSRSAGEAASASYSRLSATITHDPSTGRLLVIRSRGVSRVSSPSTGVYCITPSSLSSSTINNTIPVVAPNYSYSSGSQLFAYVRENAANASNAPCSSGKISVVTFRVVNGSLVRSDYVGFNVIVP